MVQSWTNDASVSKILIYTDDFLTGEILVVEVAELPGLRLRGISDRSSGWGHLYRSFHTRRSYAVFLFILFCFWGRVVLSQHISTPRPMRRLAQAFHSATSLATSSERAAARLDIGLVFARPLSLVRWSWTRRWVGFWLERAAIACSARLVLLAAGLLACSALCCASAWFILVTNEAPLLVRVCAGRGQLLCPWDRGGLGPVSSIPKLCFKPFRRLSAVGFVLGWHREPLLITTLQVL